MSSSTGSRRRKVARCSVPDCNKQVQTRKLCKAHGGGVRCRGANCTKLAQSRGLCVAHGGGRRCDVDSCNKLAQYKGLCLSHGGSRRCRVADCQKFVQIRGFCKAHAKKLKLIPEITRRANSPPVTPVSSSPSAESKLDISFLVSPEEPRITAPVILTALPSLISQDPAMRVFTAPRAMDPENATTCKQRARLSSPAERFT